MRILAMLLLIGFATGQPADSLRLTEKQARQKIASSRKNGQVGGSFDLRVTSTDRSYNYKLRATWITSEVAGAAARILMLARGLSAEQALAAIPPLDSNKTYVLVEIDPREGSGVIPRNWTAQFKQAPGTVLADTEWRDFLSAFPRDYAYDIFLLAFPASSTGEAELTVRIYDKVGRVQWQR